MKKFDKNCQYYLRYSNYIEEDLKRNWSSWSFGQLGFNGTKAQLDNYIESVTDENPISISGFDIYPIDIDNFRFGELYPNYWVVIDNVNANNGLSAHLLPSTLLNVSDALSFIEENKCKYDGSGDGESFDAKKGKLIYSDGWMNIIEIN